MKRILLLFCIFFSSCSWQEYFVLENNSDSSIAVAYTLSEVDLFPIFDSETNGYMATGSGDVDWNRSIILEDKDTSVLGLQFTLPPKSILILGHLSNDNYSKYDQHFINGRVFNFKKMEIKKKDGTIEITKDKFDTFFKKKNGNIKYSVN